MHDKFQFYFKNCFFGGVKLAENADLDKNGYGSYGTTFDSRSEFSLSDGSMGKNVIIFRADMSSSVHTENKGRKNILIYRIGSMQGLDYVNSRSSTFNYFLKTK